MPVYSLFKWPDGAVHHFWSQAPQVARQVRQQTADVKGLSEVHVRLEKLRAWYFSAASTSNWIVQALATAILRDIKQKER